MNEKNLEKCIWKEPAMREIEKNGGIYGLGLLTRECHQCDGYEDLCSRYIKGRKKRLNWLGLDEDYTK